jgi:hypothetical protein
MGMILAHTGIINRELIEKIVSFFLIKEILDTGSEMTYFCIRQKCCAIVGLMGFLYNS